MAKHQPGEGRRSMNVPYPTTGPQTGTGRKAVGRKPHKGEIVQRGNNGKVLKALTNLLWRKK